MRAWATSSGPSDDFSLTNIGQVKHVFSFDLHATDSAHDSDQNGLPDYEKELVILDRTEAVARHLTNHLKATDRFAKTLVFCVDQDHAQRIAPFQHTAGNRAITLQREAPGSWLWAQN